MAKKAASKQVEIDLHAEIAALTNGDVLDDLASVRYYIDTGNLAFNYVCSGRFIGGGVPGEKVTELFGPSSSGKTLVANNILHGCQQVDGWAVLLDCENASNKEFMARASHVDPKKLIRFTPRTLEEAFLKIHTFSGQLREYEAKKGLPRKPIVFVYDSLASSPCERELKETNLPENYKAADWKKIVGRQEQPGERAKVINNELRKLNAKLEEYGATVIFINQIRMQIGVLYGNPETRPGGKALEFYATCILRTQQKKKIENKKLETFAGVNMQCKNVKNKVFDPFVQAEDIKVYFKTGIDPVSGLLRCLIQSERINMYSAGRFEVMPEYLPEGMDEYKFQARKTENEMSIQPILDCPKLVDAATTEEVQAYLDEFKSAMETSASGDYIQKMVAYDGDGTPTDVDDENDAWSTEEDEDE